MKQFNQVKWILMNKKKNLKKKLKLPLTYEGEFAIINKSLRHAEVSELAESKTKDLVIIAIVWVQVPSSALRCEKALRNQAFLLYKIWYNEAC